MTSLIGQQWGNYRLTQTLGQGGFAEVYLGEHIHLGNKVAVKILYTRLDEKGIQQFMQEAKTLTNLPHPHIIRILDFGFDNNNIPYLIMEFASGGTLAKRHPLGIPVPLATTVQYIKQVSEALQYAHQNNIIHRDIKPENMLIGQNNTILLSDFGIARVVQTYSVGTGHITGSFQYMAPEQGAGKAVFSSDQYSLGVVTYQWLCGNLPFQGNNMELMVQHRMEASPPFPLQLRIPSAIENVVMKALDKNPQQRFATVQEFASTLEQTSRGMPFQAQVTQFGASNQGRTYASPQQQPTQASTNDIDALCRHGVEAYAKGDLEQAEQLWQQVLKMDPNYGNGTLAPRMAKLKSELDPIRVKRLREQALAHSKAGAWNQEIEWWSKLLTLEPQDAQAQERRSLAQHNMQYAWMYTNAEQFVREGKLNVAKTELTNLWHDAPYYGDPAELARKVGLNAPVDYEQAKATQQKRQLLEEQEQQKRQSIEEKEQQRQQSIEEKVQDRQARRARLMPYRVLCNGEFLKSTKLDQDRLERFLASAITQNSVWYQRGARFGASIFLMLYLFLFIGGVGAFVGIMANYWTSQAWIIAGGTSVILVPIAYVLGYRKVMTLPLILLPSLLGIAGTVALTRYISHLNYSYSEASHFWFLNHTLWIGRQLTFGLVIGITCMLMLVLIALTTIRRYRR